MKTIFTLGLLSFCAASFAQTFNAPESVEHDGANNRWIVGQNGGNVVTIYSPASGSITNFGTTITSGPHGIEVLGDTVYACDGARIRGYDINTGAQVFNVNLGATFLNGLTSDGAHTLFATDFSAKRIYRVNVLSGTYNIMVTTVKTPNGIIYDGPNNRCVFVTWGSSAPVQAMSLADSTISTLLNTSLGNCDGITRDQQGNWYVTAWTGNALFQIDPAFSSAPVNVMSGLSSPADIDINAAGDSIGIPNSGSANNVVFYTGIPTGLAQPQTELRAMTCFPNPAATQCMVTLEQEVSEATLSLFDASGKSLQKRQVSGKNFLLERGDLPEGFYFVTLHDAQQKLIAVQKVAFFAE